MLHNKDGVLEVGPYIIALFDPDFIGVAVDVGAYHTYWQNSTYILECSGWEVHCIESNPNCVEQLKGRAHVYQCAVGADNQDDIDFYVVTLGDKE